MNPHDKYAAELQKEQSFGLSYEQRKSATKWMAILGMIVIIGACV